MTELDDIFEKAYQLQEDAAITSKAYVTLFRTELFVPTHKINSLPFFHRKNVTKCHFLPGKLW